MNALLNTTLNTQPIGILGGTFDPIHSGHLRTAVELRHALNLKEVRFIPCQNPVHKNAVLATATQRLKMLQLAIENEPGLIIDTRELDRETPSYTALTLQSLRQEHPDTPLILIMGVDALMSLESWYHWDTLFDLAHILAVHREGYHLHLTGDLQFQVENRLTDQICDLHTAIAGRVLSYETRLLDISATEIRNLLQNHQSARYLLPDSVLTYIQNEQIYTG